MSKLWLDKYPGYCTWWRTPKYSSQVSKHPQLTHFLDYTWLNADFKLGLHLGHN